jgi:hypothetical protein
MPGHFVFKFEGEVLGTTLDLTGAEIRRLEKRLGVTYGQITPMLSMDHRLAVMETFLARTIDPEDARRQVEALDLRTLDTDCVEFRDGADDLPGIFEDGLPKAEDGTATT